MASRTRTETVLLWIAQIAAAGMFLLAGTAKLRGAAPMVQMFAAIGVGQWFRVVTGGIEVVGAGLLLVPSLAAYGALLLVPTMAGAIITHLAIIGGSPAIPAALLVTTALIGWRRVATR